MRDVVIGSVVHTAAGRHARALTDRDRQVRPQVMDVFGPKPDDLAELPGAESEELVAELALEASRGQFLRVQPFLLGERGHGRGMVPEWIPHSIPRFPIPEHAVHVRRHPTEVPVVDLKEALALGDDLRLPALLAGDLVVLVRDVRPSLATVRADAPGEVLAPARGTLVRQMMTDPRLPYHVVHGGAQRFGHLREEAPDEYRVKPLRSRAGRQRRQDSDGRLLLFHLFPIDDATIEHRPRLRNAGGVEPHRDRAVRDRCAQVAQCLLVHREPELPVRLVASRDGSAPAEEAEVARAFRHVKHHLDRASHLLSVTDQHKAHEARSIADHRHGIASAVLGRIQAHRKRVPDRLEGDVIIEYRAEAGGPQHSHELPGARLHVYVKGKGRPLFGRGQIAVDVPAGRGAESPGGEWLAVHRDLEVGPRSTGGLVPALKLV